MCAKHLTVTAVSLFDGAFCTGRCGNEQSCTSFWSVVHCGELSTSLLHQVPSSESLPLSCLAPQNRLFFIKSQEPQSSLRCKIFLFQVFDFSLALSNNTFLIKWMCNPDFPTTKCWVKQFISTSVRGLGSADEKPGTTQAVELS